MYRTATATANLAVNMIAKSLDQAIASLDEIEAQIVGVGLNDDDVARIALDLTAQRDRLDLVYDIATRVIGLLHPAPPRCNAARLGIPVASARGGCQLDC